MINTTESASTYNNLEQMETLALLQGINQEDQSVPLAVAKQLPAIEALVNATHTLMAQGGRLFYLGAGTSGRLGIVDASECPPTFGVPHGMVIGIIAGGDTAIRKAVEFAEDDEAQGFKDLQAHGVAPGDMVVGIAASGRTPYVIGALKACRAQGIATGCIVCNSGSPVAAEADYPVEVVVGPEFVTGSTRMKSGTAQKLVMNMLTTAVMIKLGKVRGNRMVDMQLSNHKLVDRGNRMVAEALQVPYDQAAALLQQHGSVRAAIDHFRAENKSAN